MPASDSVGVHDHQSARPRGPGGTKRDPECAVDIVERRARPLLLERRHLLPERQVLHNQIGPATTDCSDHTGAERDEEDENTKNGGRVCLFRSVISSELPL